MCPISVFGRLSKHVFVLDFHPARNTQFPVCGLLMLFADVE
jgi:hypothetical protein